MAYISRRTGYNQALVDKGYQTDYSSHPVDPSVRGIKRIERLQAEGPQPMDQTLEDQRLRRYQDELVQCLQQLEIDPPPIMEWCQTAQEQYSKVTEVWFRAFCDNGFNAAECYPLGNAWLEAFADPPYEYWAEFAFLKWADLPRFVLLQRAAFLEGCLKDTREAPPPQPQPHRPLRMGTANRSARRYAQHHVRQRYEEQPALERAILDDAVDQVPSRQGYADADTALRASSFLTDPSLFRTSQTRRYPFSLECLGGSSPRQVDDPFG